MQTDITNDALFVYVFSLLIRYDNIYSETGTW